VNEAGVAKQVEGANARNKTREVVRDSGARSKILLHFMKGRISLTPMETIMNIPGELEYLEGLVKLARRRKDEEADKNQVAIVNITRAVIRISMNKNYRGKTMHLPVEINNGTCGHWCIYVSNGSQYSTRAWDHAFGFRT
jgi:hypothetical protein